jgi:hypothetical protein
MPPFSYTLAQHLELTYLEYEALRQHYFEHWCTNLCIPHLTKNDHLLNWYAQQWHIQVERSIEQNYSDALSLYTPEDIHLLILIYAENILQYYPSILLKKITARAAHTEH